MEEKFPAGESLDVGTATGRYLLAAHSYGLDAWGIDINPAAIDFTQKKLRDQGLFPNRAILADVHSLPLVENRFSLITCMMGTIHHCTSMDLAVSEMARVLAGDGGGGTDPVDGVTWDGDAGDGLWNAAANWSGDAL